MELTSERRDAAIDVALARGVLYNVLAVGLQAPSPGSIARLTSPEAALTLWSAAQVAGVEADGRLATAVHALAQTAAPAFPEVVMVHSSLFGHTARGRVCPYETEYGADGLFQQSHQLADIAGYYLAFGLEPTNRADERVDHIGCECEFLDFLCRKEALLLARRTAEASSPADEATLEETRRAARSFLQQHLARFGLAFATRLVAEDADGFYGHLGGLLLRLLESDCIRLGVTPGPASMELRSTAADDVPMACGSGEELIQIQGLKSGSRTPDSGFRAVPNPPESGIQNPESRIRTPESL